MAASRATGCANGATALKIQKEARQRTQWTELVRLVPVKWDLEAVRTFRFLAVRGENSLAEVRASSTSSELIKAGCSF